MSWPVFLVLARAPAWLFFGVLAPSGRGTRHRWWGGRALLSTVVNFCVALFVTALMAVALDRHALG